MSDMGNRRFELRRRTAVGVLVLLVLTLAVGYRRALLRQLASVLIVDQQVAGATVLWVRNGDRRFDIASRWYHENPDRRRLLLIEKKRQRVMSLGLVPTDLEVGLRELLKRQVPKPAIELLRTPCRTRWDEAARFRRWLTQHPGVQVVVLEDRFRSRLTRYILDQTLPAPDRGRVFVRGLPDRRFDENNWWAGRDRIETVVDGYLRLAYAVLHGPDSEVPPAWHGAQALVPGALPRATASHASL